MYELVIFDCDGVLVDSEAISNDVLARMLTREGLTTTLREARRDYQGMLLTDICRQVEAKLGRPLPAGWLAEYERERARAFQRGLEPVGGAAETVRRVKAAGLKVCVASQGALAKTRMTLGLTQSRRIVENRHGGQSPKPIAATSDWADPADPAFVLLTGRSRFDSWWGHGGGRLCAAPQSSASRCERLGGDDPLAPVSGDEDHGVALVERPCDLMPRVGRIGVHERGVFGIGRVARDRQVDRAVHRLRRG